MEVVIPDLDDDELFAPPPRIHSPVASASASSAVDSGRLSLEDSSSPCATMSAAAQKAFKAVHDSATMAAPSGSRALGKLTMPSSLAGSSAGGPFRGAALGWHGRSGSATSDSSAGGASFRFPTSGTSGSSPYHQPQPLPPNRYESSPGGFFPPSPSHQTGSNFSFPVKKSSFASLKAAIKGQSQSNGAKDRDRDRDAFDAWPPRTPKEAARYVPYAPGSDAGENTAGRRTAYPTPKPGMAISSSGPFPFEQQQQHPDVLPSMSGSQEPMMPHHARRDSQLSGHSRTQVSGGTGASFSGAAALAARSSSRYHHAQHSSYYSDSHNSHGAASSSASSLMLTQQSLGQSGADLPPVPPLPLFGYDYNAAPSTPGTEPVDPAFLDARAMASNTSFEHSDMGSPHKWNAARLRDDNPQRPWMTVAEDADEASSVEYSSQQHHHHPHPHPSNGTPSELGGGDPGQQGPGTRSRRPSAANESGRPQESSSSALAASLGAEGLGYLPQGIGSNDPKAPSEYAVNILMSRFITLTGLKIQATLDSLGDGDPERMSAVGPQVDESLESLYDSLSHVAKRNPWPVIESLVNWKQLHIESQLHASAVRRHLAESRQLHAAETGMKDVAALLARRKELITLYLLSKAMIAIAKEMGCNTLTEAQAGFWEDCAFDMLLRCSRESDRERHLPRSVSTMRYSCFEKVSVLIGEISRTRFLPISERFVSILESSKEAPAGKNVEEMLVAAIQSMGHLKVTVYPMELFEEGAEFVEILARHFAVAHGTRIKTAYAEAFLHLLLPVAQSATAEVNHPTWTKGIDNIWPRALSMTAKPRYWAAAYSLAVALLAVSPPDKFLTNWYACIEMGAAKLKDRGSRTIVLNAALRLLWVYLFRCHESSSTTTRRLEAFFKIWFPPSRKAVHPSECSLEPLIGMVHLVLHRHFDFGRDLVLNFLCHAELGGSTLSLQPDILSGHRMTVAIRAILLTVDGYAREESPAFPAGVDFSRYQFETLPKGCGDELPDGFAFPRPELAEAQGKFNDLIGKIALICDHQVSDMTVFDERTQIFRGSVNGGGGGLSASSGDRAMLERDGFIWKVHGTSKLMAAYPREHQSHCDLLKACFASWPRCLTSNIAFSSILGILFRAHFSADPELAEASSEALQRIAQQRRGGSTAVVSGFMRWIFRQESAFWEIHPRQSLLIPKVERAVRLWIDFLNIWLAELHAQNSAVASEKVPGAKGFEMERTSAWAIIDEVEAHALFLLCSASRLLRKYAVEVLGLVSVLDDAFLTPARRAALEAARAAGDTEDEEPSRIVHLLNLPYCRFFEDPYASAGPGSTSRATSGGLPRPPSWKAAQTGESLKSIAQSEKASEQQLWRNAFPTLLRMSLDRFPTTIAVFRSYITRRVLGMDHVILVAADIVSRPQVGTIGGSGAGKAVQSSSSSLAHTTTMSSFVSTGAIASDDHDVSQDQALMAEHWRFYILALCTTTNSTEGSRGGASVGGHRRQSSDAESGERVIAAKDLFQKMVPFLASSQARFRDAVVTALGNINDNLFGTLLDTVQSVSSTLTDDFKVRSVARSGLKRNRRLDRLRTALGQVLQLNSHHLRREESARDAKVIHTIQTWLRETFSFLNDREIRQDWEFHVLRRFFCGVAEEFFDGLTRLGEAERYFPRDVRLRMFRAFREWHSYSNTSEEGPAKLANMLAAAAEQHRDDQTKEQAVVQLRNETQALSYQAGRAMASFCQGAIANVGGSANVNPSPTGASSLEASSLLSWLNHLFSAANRKNHEVARRALGSLLVHNAANAALIDSILERCISEPDRSTEGRSFFSVVADVVVESDTAFAMPLHQTLCLGLIKLGHANRSVRRKAFRMLHHVSTSVDGDSGKAATATAAAAPTSLEAFEVGATSPLPAIYLRAQRDISEHLAEHYLDLKSAVLSELAHRMPHIDAARRATTLGLLPEWLRGLELVPLSPEVIVRRPNIAYRTYVDLSNLLFLTVEYGDSHSFEVQDAWSSLAGDVDVDRKQNVDAVIRFLIDQGLRLRNPEFVVYAKRVVSCLSHTSIRRYLFDELCALVEPGRMIPVPREERRPLTDERYAGLYCVELDRLLPEPVRKLTFSPGQLALFLVGEMAYEGRDQLAVYLPALLHAALMHVDSFSPFVQQQAGQTFEQLLRCVVSTFPAVGDGSAAGGAAGKAACRAQVEALFSSDRERPTWSLDDAENEQVDHCKMPRSLLATAAAALSIFETFLPEFREEWGAVALLWAISGPVRHMACRSFQAFRVIRPKVTPSMMADMLGRLSDTISDPNPDIQAFALEILYTLNLVIRTSDVIQQDFLAQSWWATLACLSTVNEREFAESIAMLDSLLDKLDIGSSEVVAMLKIKCPEGWEGEAGGAQGLVFRGLRSSVTSKASFRLLAKLAKCRDPALIDYNDTSRLGFLFMAALPWFLQVTDEHFQETSGAAMAAKNDQRKQAGVSAAPVRLGGSSAAAADAAASLTALSPLSIIERQMVLELASDLAAIADRLGMKDLERVATSISKTRFRTKDDLVRQAVNCIRSRYMPAASADMAVLLLGITLNEADWLRRQTMQVLKIFFKVVDTRNDVAFSSLGSELLMPLLRLLSTPLSAEALEVLDEPISINGGPAANQILRMSLQWGNQPGRMREQVSDASIFGPPADSGWAVALPQDLTTRTRINIQAVFKMCELTLDIAPMSSNVNFVVEDGYDLVASHDAHLYMLPDEALGVSDPSVEDLSAGPRLSEIVNQLHDLSTFFVEENRRSGPGSGPSSGSIHRAGGGGGGRFGSIVSGLGGSQSLSRQSSLRNLPYKRHTPQDSEASAGQDGTKVQSADNAPASSRSHAQIAKILARSAFGGRMSFYGGRPGSTYRRSDSTAQYAHLQEHIPGADQPIFQGDVAPMRSISEPVPGSSVSQGLHTAAPRHGPSQALTQMLEEPFEPQQPEKEYGGRHVGNFVDDGEQRYEGAAGRYRRDASIDVFDDDDRRRLHGADTTYDVTINSDAAHGLSSTNSGSLSFGFESSPSTVRTGDYPSDPYLASAAAAAAAAAAAIEPGKADASSLRRAHAALQKLAAAALGAPFEESPSHGGNSSQRVRSSPTRPRTLMLRRAATDDSYSGTTLQQAGTDGAPKGRSAQGRGEKPALAGQGRGYAGGAKSRRPTQTGLEDIGGGGGGRFDSVANKSAISNA